MGKKRKLMGAPGAAAPAGGGPNFHHEAIEPAHIRIAAHGPALAVAMGNEVRLTLHGNAVATTADDAHKGFVRDIGEPCETHEASFPFCPRTNMRTQLIFCTVMFTFYAPAAISPDHKYVVSGADDKTAKLWDLSTGKCLATLTCPKKISAVGFTNDSAHFLFADKFGDVFSSSVAGPFAANFEELQFLMGHFCTIVTSLRASPCGRLVATTEKDTKARITWLPKPIQAGDGEIQAFCVGHEAFTICCEFVEVAPGHHALLTSSGDGTLGLWDPMTGRRIDTLHVPSVLPALAEGTTPEAPLFAHSLAVSGSTVLALVTAQTVVPGTESKPAAALELHCTATGFDAAQQRVVDLGESGVVGCVSHGGGGVFYIAEARLDEQRRIVPRIRTVRAQGGPLAVDSTDPALPAAFTAPGLVLTEKEAKPGLGYVLTEMRKKATSEEFKTKLEERKRQRNDLKKKAKKAGAMDAGAGAPEDVGDDSDGEGSEEGGGEDGDE